jgi:hypothetical protein
MSVLLDRANAWEVRPGWGIAVDLTPGEVVNARRVGGTKKLVVGMVVLAVLVAAGLTFLALQDKWAAQDEYDAAQLETSQLQAEAREYADITLMETTISDIDSKLSVLMAEDVDFVNLMAKIRLRLPKELTIDNISILLAPDDPTAAPVDPNAPAPTDGRSIGTLVISGSGSAIDALAPFVKDLAMLRGVVDVVPTSVNETEDGMMYALTMNITDELYTHRFDAQAAAPATTDGSVQ